MANTSTGLQENIAALLCYVLGWVSGVIFLIIEPDNKLIRFHAFQSILVFGILTVVGLVFIPVPILGVVLNWLCGVLGFIMWVALMVMAAQEYKYKVPWVGNLAEKWAG
jgi:uncharacterized membrane protein